MPIVGGLDIHRKQITFDYLTRPRGRCGAARSRSPIASTWPGGWRAGSPARTRTSRWRGAPGGGTWRRGWPRPGRSRMSPSPPIPRRCEAASGTPRRTRPIPGTCGCCWPTGGCPSAGSRRRTSWNAGRCSSCIMTCGPGTLPGCSAFTRCCSTRARRSSAGRGCAPARAWPRCGRPRPGCRAGQLQVAVALDMLQVLEGHLDAVRRRLLAAARQLPGARELHARLYGVGPITALALCCWLGGAGRFSSARKAVRFAGLDITVWSSDRKGPPGRLSRQGPEVLRWCVYEALARPTPAAPPRTTSTTRRSKSGSTASAPPSPRPARSSGRRCTSWPHSAMTR